MLKELVKSIKDDEFVKFRLSMGFKFALIPTIALVSSVVMNYILLRVTLSVLASFESGKNYIVEDVIFIFAEKGIVTVLMYSGVVFVCLFVLGMFVANVTLRPFKVIGEYCESSLESDELSYDPDFLSELKLLSSFSEWFFSVMLMARETKIIKGISIPSKYKRIHKPVFETSFFIQNFLIIIITTLATGFLIHIGTEEVYTGVIEVIREAYPSKGTINAFLVELNEISWQISNFCILINALLYFLFSIYLYSKISTPAFGIFATMRSFVSGKYSSRVHLIGFPYVRKYTRMVNKYLDHLEKEYTSKDN